MNKKEFTKKELEIIRHIATIFIHEGKAPSIRKLQKLMEYKSTNSIALIIKSLVDKGVLEKRNSGKIQFKTGWDKKYNNVRTVDVPLVGLVACGTPILAEENIEAKIPISVKIAKPPYRYYLLKVNGNSMNKAGIKDGDLVLIRQQSTANNGDKVIGLIDDEATLKFFYRLDNKIILKPDSTEYIYKPIILTEDFKIQGIVVDVIPDVF